MTVNWGILGASKFALNFMGPAIHAAKGARLVALATSSPDKAAPFKAFAPDLRVHLTYDALLTDPDIDAIYIPLPNHLHVEWTLKALAAGKHVLCEKPMTMHATEFDQLIAARDDTGKLAAEAYMILHHPQWQFTRELVQTGEIGALTHISAKFSFDNRHDTENIRNRPETGGGALRDIGVYVFGAARFVADTEASDISARVRFENDVDVTADVQAKFGETLYSAYVSTRMHPYQEMYFHGEKGVIRLTAPFNARVFGEARVEVHKGSHVGGGAVATHRFPADDHYVLQVEAFGRSIAGAHYPVPLEFSRGTQEMIDEVLKVCTKL